MEYLTPPELAAHAGVASPVPNSVGYPINTATCEVYYSDAASRHDHGHWPGIGHIGPEAVASDLREALSFGMKKECPNHWTAYVGDAHLTNRFFDC